MSTILDALRKAQSTGGDEEGVGEEAALGAEEAPVAEPVRDSVDEPTPQSEAGPPSEPFPEPSSASFDDPRPETTVLQTRSVSFATTGLVLAGLALGVCTAQVWMGNWPLPFSGSGDATLPAADTQKTGATDVARAVSGTAAGARAEKEKRLRDGRAGAAGAQRQPEGIRETPPTAPAAGAVAASGPVGGGAMPPQVPPHSQPVGSTGAGPPSLPALEGRVLPATPSPGAADAGPPSGVMPSGPQPVVAPPAGAQPVVMPPGGPEPSAPVAARVQPVPMPGAPEPQKQVAMLPPPGLPSSPGGTPPPSPATPSVQRPPHAAPSPGTKFQPLVAPRMPGSPAAPGGASIFMGNTPPPGDQTALPHNPPTGAPEVSLLFIQYSQDLSRRVASLRGPGGKLMLVHEGDIVLEGMRVATIRPDSIELEWGGAKFLLLAAR